MIEVIKPPFHHPKLLQKTGIFLAGSIEMGKAEDWQLEMSKQINDYIPYPHHNDFLIFNPRRDNWNPEWEQTIRNPEFKQQVDWEMNHLSHARYRIFYFQPATISPISLLEFGKYGHGRSIVICPDGYFRKGNLEIFCDREGITLTETIEHAAFWLKSQIKI